MFCCEKSITFIINKYRSNKFSEMSTRHTLLLLSLVIIKRVIRFSSRSLKLYRIRVIDYETRNSY